MAVAEWLWRCRGLESIVRGTPKTDFGEREIDGGQLVERAADLLELLRVREPVAIVV